MSTGPLALPPPLPGTLHRYTRRLGAFEHAPSASSTTQSLPHTLLWIGGLGDGLATVSYTTVLARALPPSWRLVQSLLSSAYDQWGFRTLAQDAHDLAACVAHFRRLRPGRRVVIMGHSTGCQDVMEYLVGPQTPEGGDARPPLDGAILQAPVSDREGMEATGDAEKLAAGVATAQAFVARGLPDEILPRAATGNFFGVGVPVTARRWLSLASPDKRGEDDYFSSDLGDERLGETFGRWPRETRLQVLFGGADKFVPDFVDKEALVRRWEGFVKGAGGVVDEDGGVIPGAGHGLEGDPEEVVDDLVGRVVRCLRRVEADDDESTTI